MLLLHVYDLQRDRRAVVVFDSPRGLKEQALEALQAGCVVKLTGAGLKRPRMDDIDSVRAFPEAHRNAVEGV